MIGRLAGWTRTERADLVILTHARGAAHAEIRYRERVRPVRPLDAHLASIVTAPDVRDVRVTDTERFATLEGENAQLVCVSAKTPEGESFAMWMGTVQGDDFQAVLSATTARIESLTELATIVRELLFNVTLALGVRRRSVEHVGPLGWTSTPRALAHDWLAPANDAVIRVFPVEPSRSAADPLANLIAASHADGCDFDDLDGPYEAPSARGEAWTIWRLSGRTARGELWCDAAMLADAHYSYLVILESFSAIAQARHRDALRAVLASIAPLASIQHASDAVLAASAHWAL